MNWTIKLTSVKLHCMESPEEFRERLHNDANKRVEDILNNSTSLNSTVIMGWSKELREQAIKEYPDAALPRLLKVAQELEHYEICQLVMDEFSSRGLPIPSTEV
jgi:hypothetical protein